MSGKSRSSTGPHAVLRVSEVQSGASVDEGESLLVTLEAAGGGMVDVLLSHELGPRLQRLLDIVGDQAAQKRASGGNRQTRVTAERVAGVEMVLPTHDGSVLVQLATAVGYPIAFALPRDLVGELAERLAEQVPSESPSMRH